MMFGTRRPSKLQKEMGNGSRKGGTSSLDSRNLCKIVALLIYFLCPQPAFAGECGPYAFMLVKSQNSQVCMTSSWSRQPPVCGNTDSPTLVRCWSGYNIGVIWPTGDVPLKGSHHPPLCVPISPQHRATCAPSPFLKTKNPLHQPCRAQTPPLLYRRLQRAENSSDQHLPSVMSFRLTLVPDSPQ